MKQNSKWKMNTKKWRETLAASEIDKICGKKKNKK